MNRSIQSDRINDGVILVGRIGFIEYMQGLNDGCYASLSDQPKTAEQSETSKSIKEGDDNSDVKPPQESQEFIKDVENFSVPELEPIGYIHFYNRIGWKYVPLRIYHAFNSYRNFDIASHETAQVALGKKRKFTKEDLKLGKDEEKFFKGKRLEELNLDEKIIEKLIIFK